MAYSDTVLKQLLSFVPRYEFDALADVHHSVPTIAGANFLALLAAQLSGRTNLRDITENLMAQGKWLYHLGMKRTTKATLARVTPINPPPSIKRCSPGC